MGIDDMHVRPLPKNGAAGGIDGGHNKPCAQCTPKEGLTLARGNGGAYIYIECTFRAATANAV